MNTTAESIQACLDGDDTDTRRLDTSNLRVAIFSDAMPERNGAGAYYEDLARHLRPRLEVLQLIQPVLKKRFLKFALPLPGDSTQKLITPNLYRISKDFSTLDPHLVISVTPGPFGLLGCYLARRKGCGYLTAFHTHFEGLVKLYGNTLFFRIAEVYLRLVNGYLCRNSDSVLINNVGLTDTVKQLGAREVDVMGTPLAKVFLDKPLIPPAKPLQQVLFAGRLAPEKNIPAILEAVRDLPQINFVVAGTGPLRQQLEMAAKQFRNLRLTGWLNRHELCDEIDQAELLILPSHMETFGTVALEALARGRPALVAESAGIHTWPSLSDSLFTISNDQSLTEALNNLLRLPDRIWAEKAGYARQAAETLNDRTVKQWQRFIKHYSRHDC